MIERTSEKTSPQYTVTLTDTAKVPIPSANIHAIYATIENLDATTKPAYINNRNHQNVFGSQASPVNGGWLHATSGVFTLDFSPDDTVIQDQGRSMERHRVLIEWEWEAGAKAGSVSFEMLVTNEPQKS